MRTKNGGGGIIWRKTAMLKTLRRDDRRKIRGKMEGTRVKKKEVLTPRGWAMLCVSEG